MNTLVIKRYFNRNKYCLNVLLLPVFFFFSLSVHCTDIKTKDILIKKLETLTFFSANFEQNIIDATGEVLQQSFGKLSISKPNSLYWETFEPDELYIIADGTSVWFYNPWIDQVSIYPVSTAIAKTPLLLLTSKDMFLWQQYNVVVGKVTNEMRKNSETSFIISPIDNSSQIKSLTLYFTSSMNDEQLSQFTFLDATGQISQIKLNKFDAIHKPDPNIFTFSVPEGVTVEDFRKDKLEQSISIDSGNMTLNNKKQNVKG